MQYTISQYKVSTPLADMNVESAIKVANYFAQNPYARATAAELDVSGAFMTSLVRRGYVNVVGERDCGFRYVGDGLYRKNMAHEYSLRVTAEQFWNDYTLSSNNKAKCLKDSATYDIEVAQRKLDEAKNLLTRIEGVRF